MSRLAELFETTIPAGRSDLQENCVNLRNVAAYCDDNYQQAADKKEALGTTKQYVAQSLASVAYQINTLAASMMEMLDLQGDQVEGMAASINHLARNVNIHKEKVARREIGLLTTAKACPRTHKIVAPENLEKPCKNVSRSAPIDYSLLDGIGHGFQVKEPPKAGSSAAPAAASHSPAKRSDSDGGPTTPTDSPFPVFQPGPDPGPPPKSPTDSTLYASVHKLSSTSSGTTSPRSVKKYRTKAGTTAADFITCPPPPPLPPALARTAADEALPPPPPDAPTVTAPPGGPQPPMAPPPPPLPGEVLGTNKTAAPASDDLDLMPPPPPPDMPIAPQDTAGYPAPPAEPISYPANLGLTDEEMPPPPEFLVASDADSSAPAEYLEKVIAIYAYQKQFEDELSIEEDDILYVVEKNPNGWYEGVLNGVKGVFPGNYVQPVP